MDVNHGGNLLSEMSDGALRKAIQSLENAKRSVEYAILMLPDDEWDDLDAVDGSAKDASERISEQLRALDQEWDRRE